MFQDAILLSDKQDSKPARLKFQEAMRLWIQMREPGKAAGAALQIGDRNKHARAYQEALDDYRLALNVTSLPGALKATVLNAIAQTYAELYLNDQAHRYFNSALDQARLVRDVPAQMAALTGLADIHRQQGAREKALECITRALRLAENGHVDADAPLLYLKGEISREQELTENAKGAFSKALSIYEATGNVAGQVKALCALSDLSLQVSQNQVALDQAKQAVDLAEKQVKLGVSHSDFVNARELRWRAWLRQARAERALGEIETARKSYLRTTNHFEALWWESYILTETSAVAFREEAQVAYREYVDLLIDQEKFTAAFDKADQAKARTLVNFIGARKAKPASVDSEQDALLRAKSRYIADLRLQLLASTRPREQANLQRQIEQAEFDLEEIRLQGEMKRAKERLVWTQPAAAAQLQEQLSQAGMTLAAFSLGEKRSFVWLFTRGNLHCETLPPQKEIENAVKQYLDLLATPPSQFSIERDLARLKERSEKLYSILFGHLSAKIEPGERLIIVPDGLLHYLPFESLIHNGHYLIEDHEISYSPSAGMLVQQNRSSDAATDRLELLAFADPIFGGDSYASALRRNKRETVDVARRARDSTGFQLPRLPRTRDEAESVVGLFPPGRTRLYLGKDSTEDALKKELLRRYRRLHFATHSLVDETSPSRSAVVLTIDGDPVEDGFLEVSEIAALDLDCELVVLSACQTGRGQLLRGEGIVGLSRAFLYAGARTVVVSLWNVTDISTSHLMKSFYRHLTAGIGAAAALRETKLEMLRSDNETRHPCYWSSFVIIGTPWTTTGP